MFDVNRMTEFAKMTGNQQRASEKSNWSPSSSTSGRIVSLKKMVVGAVIIPTAASLATMLGPHRAGFICDQNGHSTFREA